MDDAFAAIDNGGKLRRPDELPFDLCFGGRRQFCNSNYADLGETQICKESRELELIIVKVVVLLCRFCVCISWQSPVTVGFAGGPTETSI